MTADRLDSGRLQCAGEIRGSVSDHRHAATIRGESHVHARRHINRQSIPATQLELGEPVAVEFAESLELALQSGNLTAAQNAFASFEQSYTSSNGQQSSSQSSQSSPVSNDIQSLSSALSSGNLTSAQQAFQQLQKDMQTQQASGHHHHHGGGGGAQGQAIQSLIASLSSSGSSSSSSGTTGNTLNVTA